MENKIKNLIISISFVGILIIAFITNLFMEDKEISITERRKLAQFPKITAKEVFNGKAMENLEEYVTDQFVGRDFFKSIKSFCSIKVLNQKDTNGLFEIDGAIYKMEYPLNTKNVQKTAEKMKKIYDAYLQDMNVYYAIIPDKNYYLKDDDHLKIDYEELKKIMNDSLTEFNYIDIWNDLTLEDYYKTDSHWKQEKLQKVVATIQKDMQVPNTSETNYKVQNKGDFYGAYYGQLGMDLPPDTLYILTNETIENCNTYNYETKENGKVYVENKTADKYDMYLHGATPLISVENPNAKTEEELLIFRDSFGSSLAPLLVENYQKITLIDTRYISSNLLGDYIKFDNQDVLFLYSTLIINQNLI